jgi:hypothetical protein
VAFGDVQADIVDGNLFPVSFGQVPGFNGIGFFHGKPLFLVLVREISWNLCSVYAQNLTFALSES